MQLGICYFKKAKKPEKSLKTRIFITLHLAPHTAVENHWFRGCFTLKKIYIMHLFLAKTTEFA